MTPHRHLLVEAMNELPASALCHLPDSSLLVCLFLPSTLCVKWYDKRRISHSPLSFLIFHFSCLISLADSITPILYWYSLASVLCKRSSVFPPQSWRWLWKESPTIWFFNSQIIRNVFIMWDWVHLANFIFFYALKHHWINVALESALQRVRMISLWNFWIPLLSFLREAQVVENSSISIMEMDVFDFACPLELSLCNCVLWEYSPLSWRTLIYVYRISQKYFLHNVCTFYLPYFRFCICVMFSFQIINFKYIGFTIIFEFKT